VTPQRSTSLDSAHHHCAQNNIFLQGGSHGRLYLRTIGCTQNFPHLEYNRWFWDTGARETLLGGKYCFEHSDDVLSLSWYFAVVLPTVAVSSVAFIPAALCLEPSTYKRNNRCEPEPQADQCLMAGKIPYLLPHPRMCDSDMQMICTWTNK
jgi:hypothetical protein